MPEAGRAMDVENREADAGVKRRGEATTGRVELRRTAAAMVLVFAMIARCVSWEERGGRVSGGSGVQGRWRVCSIFG